MIRLIDNDGKIYSYKILFDVEFAINNTIHKVTGETPSKLLFGVGQKGKIIDKIQEYLEADVTNNNRDLNRIRVRAAERTKV